MKVVTRSRFGIWISILLGRFLCAFDFLLFHPKTSPSPHGVTYILRPLPVNCPTGADFAKGSSGATLASHQRHRHDARWQGVKTQTAAGLRTKTCENKASSEGIYPAKGVQHCLQDACILHLDVEWWWAIFRLRQHGCINVCYQLLSCVN